MKIIGERIIVKPLNLEANGIIIPENLKEHPTKGRVFGIGNKAPEELSELEVGDIITWMPYAGNDCVIDGQKYLSIRPNDIVALEKAEVVLN